MGTISSATVRGLCRAFPGAGEPTFVLSPRGAAKVRALVDEFGDSLAAATVVFEAREPDVPETYELPPALTPDAAARLVPIEVSLNGAFTSLDCARQPDLFDCVRDFCVGNEIEPAVRCMASLISSFQAQVL